MKKLFEKFVVVISMVLIATVSYSQSVFNLRTVNGQRAPITLKSVQKIVVVPSLRTMQVYVINGTSETYNMESIRYFNFMTETDNFTGFELPNRKSNTKVKVYPNPFINVLSIESALNINSEVTIHILSVDGKLLLEKQLYSTNDKIELNVSFLKQGVYVCKLIARGETQNIKIIK